MKELLIRQILDELDSQVVQRAEAVVDNTPDIADEKKDGLEDKQIRNVGAVADNTQSVAVVDNFIKYQMGRNFDEKKPRNEQKKWCLPDKDGKPFGEAMRDDLGQLQEWAKSKATGDVIAEELAIRLVRRYCGYLARYFKYAQCRKKGVSRV